jgi:hypothetical protein
LPNQTAAVIKAIESAFGVRASENDIRESRTLSNLSSYLLSRKRDRSREQLEGAAISYRLRIGLREATDIAPATVTDDTRLDSIFPRAKRQDQWIALEDASQLTLPSLAHPRWLAIGLLAVFLVAMGVGIGLFWTGWSTGQRLFALSVAPFWPFMLWWMSLYFTRGLARSFPRDCQTFADLTLGATRMNPMEPHAGSIVEGAPTLNISDQDIVWNLLQVLIAAETGRSIEDVSPQMQISEFF